MSASAESLPPFRVIATTLRDTTERLAAELHQPSATAPAWNEFEWRAARAVATLHGISVLLAHQLRWKGPASWRQFLDSQREHSLARDRLIDGELARIDAALRAAGVPAVALKGAALRPLGLHAAGERPMGDIDLLISADHEAATAAALLAAGYPPAFAVRRHQVFAPRSDGPVVDFGEHPGNPLKIEVHSKIAEHLPVDPVDITRHIRDATGQPGLNAYPDHAALMRHLLLHAAGNMRAHALRLVQLVDIARLAPRLDAAWEGVVDWWTWPPLALTARYFPGSIPPAVLAAASAAAPAWLRSAASRWRLADVSWSNLRIHAFPGIQWARTPGAAMRFAHSRLWPRREALKDLETGVRSQASISSTLPWYALSHPRRVARWLLTRPPRVQTMLALNRAGMPSPLESPPIPRTGP